MKTLVFLILERPELHLVSLDSIALLRLQDLEPLLVILKKLIFALLVVLRFMFFLSSPLRVILLTLLHRLLNLDRMMRLELDLCLDSQAPQMQLLSNHQLMILNNVSLPSLVMQQRSLVRVIILRRENCLDLIVHQYQLLLVLKLVDCLILKENLLRDRPLVKLEQVLSLDLTEQVNPSHSLTMKTLHSVHVMEMIMVSYLNLYIMLKSLHNLLDSLALLSVLSPMKLYLSMEEI